MTTPITKIDRVQSANYVSVGGEEGASSTSELQPSVLTFLNETSQPTTYGVSGITITTGLAVNGDSGATGYVLQSQGPDVAPIWAADTTPATPGLPAVLAVNSVSDPGQSITVVLDEYSSSVLDGANLNILVSDNTVWRNQISLLGNVDNGIESPYTQLLLQDYPVQLGLANSTIIDNINGFRQIKTSGATSQFDVNLVRLDPNDGRLLEMNAGVLEITDNVLTNVNQFFSDRVNLALGNGSTLFVGNTDSLDVFKVTDNTGQSATMATSALNFRDAGNTQYIALTYATMDLQFTRPGVSSLSIGETGIHSDTLSYDITTAGLSVNNDSGAPGQFLQSQGPGICPIWANEIVSPLLMFNFVVPSGPTNSGTILFTELVDTRTFTIPPVIMLMVSDDTGFVVPISLNGVQQDLSSNYVSFGWVAGSAISNIAISVYSLG